MQWNQLLVMVAFLALLGVGCSGINTSHGVSPATFLIPGFSQQSPERPAEAEIRETLTVQAIAPAN